MITKMDILLEYNELVITINSIVNTKKINELDNDEKLYYTEFINLINNKEVNQYNQVFITNNEVKRYVILLVESLQVKYMEEFNYDDLNDNEKIIYDNFYNNFIK